jgi:hypothetical protein
MFRRNGRLVLFLLYLAAVFAANGSAKSQPLSGTADERAKFREYAFKNICQGQVSPNITYIGNPFDPTGCNPDTCGVKVDCGGYFGQTKTGPISGEILGRPAESPSIWQWLALPFKRVAQPGPPNIWEWLIFLAIIAVVVSGRRVLASNFRELVSYFRPLGRASVPLRSAPQDQSDRTATRTLHDYDAAKWDALVKYDEEIASAEKTIHPLGQKWIDELARSYFALGDKSYLPRIVAKIQEAAASTGPLEERRAFEPNASADVSGGPARAPEGTIGTGQPPRSGAAQAAPLSEPSKPAKLPQVGGENMAKGVGIAALVLAILAIFIPLYGLFIAAAASMRAVISALAGDRIFAVAAPVITAANLLFLSPSFWYIQNNSSDKTPNYVIMCVLVGAPFVAMYLHHNGKLKIGSKI